MKSKLQDGIYFDVPFARSELESNNGRKLENSTFAIVFLRATKGSSPALIGKSLERIWNMCKMLEMGKVIELPGERVPNGALTTLIGYGPQTFNLDGARRRIPRDFKDKQFLDAIPGKPILEGCGIKYSEEICENVGLTEHIAIQFISNSQLATYRAVTEIWKLLEGGDVDRKVLRVTGFHTGFKRDDRRSWLGFHDEVSNMKDEIERKDAITIDIKSNYLQHEDFWTIGGTFLAYLKLEIDLSVWGKINPNIQELIIGRDKLTGYPLLGVDKQGKPVRIQKSKNRVSYFSDQNFREHPDYFNDPLLPKNKEKIIDLKASSRILTQSHIGRVRHVTRLDCKDPSSRRIFRQGFEFLELNKANSRKPVRVGQNFVSFQNDPNRLMFILSSRHWMGNNNFGGETKLGLANNLLSALSAGLFFVPPLEKPFPGASIFPI